MEGNSGCPLTLRDASRRFETLRRFRDASEALGVSQQAITAYEGGQRRVPISTLPLLAETLDISIEELIGTPAKRSARKRGPASKLQQQLERISALPKAQQRFVMQMPDTVLQQQGG
jgi:transcriptional regulator with XRE-family HTH domain